MNIYDYSFNLVNGKEVKLSDYKGKALLIVNIASKCGFTPQLEDLQKIYEKYNEKGLEIIGFPCDQFANQSPGSNEELNSFCKLNYGVTFKLSEKLNVLGKDAHPLFDYLTSECPFEGFNQDNIQDKMLYEVIKNINPSNIVGDSIKWNFTKFLVNKDGEVIGRFEPNFEPIKMIEDIERVL